MADGGEDEVGSITVAAFEVASAEVAVTFHVADHGLDGGARQSSRLITPNTPRLWPEMKARCGFVVLWPRRPLST